eukprot:GILJ01005016.1.p1 GENE.GILJ01005016.1~~GILJ01005016.1.p1  ORF type:complete len:538 (-),score=65.74 GILJ01005016.1:200-1813(-)
MAVHPVILVEERDEEQQAHSGRTEPRKDDEFSVGEHLDVLDTVNKWCNGEILELSSDKALIHYTGFASKWDEWISLTSPRLLKQWYPGRDIQLYNRLDVLDTYHKWCEAFVIEMNDKQVKIHYKGFVSKWDEWIDKQSDRIRPVGTYSSAFGIGKLLSRHSNSNNTPTAAASTATSSSSIHTNMAELPPSSSSHQHHLKPPAQSSSSSSSSSSSANGPQVTSPAHHQGVDNEEWFRRQLAVKNLTIRGVEGDGNCLFRAVSDQIYGTDQYHQLVRQKCLDYMSMDKAYFSQFVVGGVEEFDSYILRKRQDGCWGDDVEIQAISEIYNRPVEIYAYSNVPMRTFHEAAIALSVPIRLSYHGRSHFNSVSDGRLLTPPEPGVLEHRALQLLRQRSERALLQSDVEITEQLAFEGVLQSSRAEFETTSQSQLDAVLAASLAEFHAHQDMLTAEMQQATRMDKEPEEQMLEAALKASIEQRGPSEEALLQAALIGSVSPGHGLPPAVEQAHALGFPLEACVEAYSIVGDDAEAIIRLLCDN